VDFFQKSVDTTLEELNTSLEGLSQQEAKKRLEEYGPNEIEEDGKIHPIVIFLKQFTSPIVWILIIAIIIAFIVGEMTDMYVIGAIVILNAILGFIQEYRAEKSIQKLKEIVSLQAEVVRKGETKEVKASKLVPGDIIEVETGSKVPADARIIDQENLETQEASLTGESTSVEKIEETIEEDRGVAEQNNMIFSGTNVVKGRAKAVVVKTGMDTEMGKIAEMIQEGRGTLTPLQKRLKRVAKFLGVLGVTVALVVFGIGVFYQEQSVTSMLLVAIALSVAVIPEGLPAVITLSLSIGVQRMIKKNVLIRKLPSVETLGSATVVCTDKTGTLTHNQMTVKKIFVNLQTVDVSGSGYSYEGEFEQDPEKFQRLLKAGALNNDAEIKEQEDVDKHEAIGDPTEASLLVSAQKAGIDWRELQQKNERVKEIPFNSERKMMTTINQQEGGNIAYSKGALEKILEKCDRILIDSEIKEITKEHKQQIRKANENMTSEALRVLAFAYKEVEDYENKSEEEIESNLVFLGLQGMIDPPREEAKEAIEKCKTAGIEVKMITGDHIGTAEAIAKQLGLKGSSMDGEEFGQLKEKDLEQKIRQTTVFARVNPSHKLKIVKNLKEDEEVVAMTGDGVNDAPALKQADLGIAMGITGTDVSKEASEMILADDNFATIEKAIEEGRRIYDNIKKFLAYLLSGNFVEVLVVFFAIIFGYSLPITAIQILWVNLVTDGLPALALGTEDAEPGIMKRSPRSQKESIFKNLSSFLVVYPLAITTIILFIFTQYADFNLLLAQTLVFTMLVFIELFESFACRSIDKSVFSLGFFTNKWLLLAVSAAASLQVLILYYPPLQNLFKVTAIRPQEWLIVFGSAIISFLILEAAKQLISRSK